MNYRSVADLSKTIAANADRFPIDADLVVGIPRSGMLAASLVALSLNLPLCDLQSLIGNREITNRTTRRQRRDVRYPHDAEHVLVVDDSILSGASMSSAQAAVADATSQRATYCAVYATRQSEAKVDLAIEIVPRPRIFEWNVMHHSILGESCLDIDGVLCADPTPEESDDGPRYDSFVQNTPPLLRPTVKIARLVTSRLEKYRSQTEAWLARHDITYDSLHMLDLPDGETRRRLKPYASHKAGIYKSDSSLRLFIESDDGQACEIARQAGSPVLCWGSQIMYEPGMSIETLRVGGRSAAYRIRRMTKRLLGS